MSLIDKYKEYKADKKETDDELRRRNPDNLPTKMSIIVRIVAGGYLVYLAYQLREAPGNYTDWRKWVFLIVMILFAIAGAYSCINGIIVMAKRKYFDPNNDDFSVEAQEARAKAEEEARLRREELLAKAAEEFYQDDDEEDDEEDDDESEAEVVENAEETADESVENQQDGQEQ